MFNVNAAKGDIVHMMATHKSHFGFQEPRKAARKSEDFVTDFAQAMKDAFYRVNDLQHESDRLTHALAVRPDSVDIHDVTIAAEKARISLLLTKSIVERVTQGYRELVNLR
ncbi:MAG: hypothetical protein AMS17_11830 [Spirochaetes bacterium DG_61]|jgi:flagellar hook-basal body complex protein FliE|nr:MAG: hypothetical protein AMS17_11830 [Spirochaetes bacterium DG_61]